MSDQPATSGVPMPRVATEVRYPLAQLLAEIRAEGVNRAMGQEHLSQEVVQSLFKAYRSRHERTGE